MTISVELENLYYADKEDRELFEKGKLSESEIKVNDEKRLKRFYEIEKDIDYGEIWNCHYACLLLMHSWDLNPDVYKKAHEYAKKAVDMGSNVTKWLYAASLDRWLVSRGKLQKFGTQYNIKTGEIAPYEKSTTDEEREYYFVPKLSELIMRKPK